MAGQYLLSIDIGTESGRAALISLSGETAATSSREFPLYCPRAEWAEQDPDDWWNATILNIKDCLAKVPGAQILAIGIAGQMHATVPVDEKGALLLDRVLLWCDKRSAAICERLKSSNDQEAALQLTGNAMVPAWTGFKYRWIKENYPDVYKKTFKFLSCEAYLNLRLTGEMATDYSEASTSYLFEVKSRDWSPRLADMLGVDLAKMPRLMDSAKVLGHVTREAAALTGLAEGTPVVNGGGDMMCLLLGAGIASLGQACDVTGTAADVSVFLPEPIFDQRLMNIHHVVPGGGWISFGILDAGGGSFKWFASEFCQKQTEEAKERGISKYDMLDAGAAQVPPGAEKLFYLPYLLGERTLGSSNSRGVFFGLTPRHGIPHCVRAIQEGVTFDLNQTLEIIESKGNRVDVINAIGGGAKSDSWCLIKANIYRKKIVTFSNFEGGVVGAAILAGIGAGVYTDAADAAKKVITIDKEYSPDENLMAEYAKHYRFFRTLHDDMQPYFKQLAEL
jgi:xylulokinase